MVRWGDSVSGITGSGHGHKSGREDEKKDHDDASVVVMFV